MGSVLAFITVVGVGLMVGVEFVRDRATKEPFDGVTSELEAQAFQRGLLLLGCGRSTLRLAPPLMIDREDADIAVKILDEVISNVAAPV